MSEWKEYKLGDLGTVITGKTPSKNNPDDWGNELPFVTPTDYKNYGKFAKKAERNLSQFGIERLKGKVLPSKSILVTCIGSDMGKVVINQNPVITNQQINSIIPNSNVDCDFLYYRLVSMYETLRIYGGDGTAVPIVNKGDFENIETEIPPLPEQRAIANVLSSLDDKIDLLQRQNETLEKLAETLFRQWFVEEAKEEWEEVPLESFLDFLEGPGIRNWQYTEQERLL
jgi:type I restriction enzyme S subunit